MSARAVLAAVCLLTAPALAACGAGERRPPASHPPARNVDPRPAEGVGAVVARVQGAATASTCTAVKGLLHSVYPTISDLACRAVRAEIGAFDGPASRAYGTGAVIDYAAAPGRRKLMALALDTDRTFRVAFVEDASSPSIPTHRPPGFDAAALAVVAAMRRGDCNAFLRLVDRKIGLGTGKDEQVCRRVSDEPFRRELQSNRRARPVPIGGNALIAFYKVRTAPTRYYTMVMLRRAALGSSLGGAARFLLVNAFPA